MGNIMGPKLLTTTMADFQLREYATYLPAPGEVIIVRYLDSDKTNMKVGDGVHTLHELPLIFLDDVSERMTMMDKTCAQCEHLCIINRNKIYAVCDETGKIFELWRMDTRDSDACDKFTPKEKTLSN